MFPNRKQKPTQAPRRRPGGTDPAVRRNQAFSYAANRSMNWENTGRGQAARPPAKRKILGSLPVTKARYAIGAALLIGLVIYSIGLNTNPTVVMVGDNASRALARPANQYQLLAQDTLSKSIWNHNKLTINTDRVAADIQRASPEIKDARIALPVFGQRPRVYIEPYAPAFVLTTRGGNAFIVDTSGRALVPASQSPVDVSKLALPVLNDQSGIEVTSHAQALPKSTVSFVRVVLSQLKASNVKYGSLVLPPSASEFDLYVSGTPYFVKFNLQDDARQQVGTFLAAKQKLNRDHVVPTQYMDVRVPERLYYK